MTACRLIGVCAAFAVVTACGPSKPRSTLLVGLIDMPMTDAIATLDRRLAQRFPPGTLESDLMRGLEADGFEREFPCETSRCVAFGWWPDDISWLGYTVNWETDAKGRVTMIRSQSYIN